MTMVQVTKNKVLIAMSGGVDSSAAALLCMQAGYACEGVTLCLHPEGTAPYAAAVAEAEDAARVAAHLGFPHRTVYLAEEFRERVTEPFISAYERGLTPNPCILCNRHIKFGALLDLADALGCDKLVTGHYARICEQDGVYSLLRAACPEKDQSYVLFGMGQRELSRTLFPLGELASKDEARALAREAGLDTCRKRDSQDICFIPDGDYVAYIEAQRGTSYPEGNFVTEDGRVLGRHRGIICYTPGQRRGLGLSLPAPLYVKSKSPEANEVILTEEAGLYGSSLMLGDVSWCKGTAPCASFRATVKARYRAKELPALVTLLEGGEVHLSFDGELPRAAAPGQAAVLYLGDEVLGGGTILPL